MANIDGRNMWLYLINSKRTIRNTVVFLTIYICTINLLLLFDNTMGMMRLKIYVTDFENPQSMLQILKTCSHVVSTVVLTNTNVLAFVFSFITCYVREVELYFVCSMLPVLWT